MLQRYFFVYILHYAPALSDAKFSMAVRNQIIDIKSFRSHYGPGVDSASNRNEYQEYFLGVEEAGA